MTLQELWELFPIVLVDYDPAWSAQAQEEIDTLELMLKAFRPVITHVGSTAIGHIKSKPIIDILVETEASFSTIRDTLDSEGYICMSEGDNRMSFNKGYTPEGYAEKVYHIHVRKPGDNAEILFRDWLREHPQTASEYEDLKINLLAKYGKDRDGYTAAKSDFVNEVLNTARATKPPEY